MKFQVKRKTSFLLAFLLATCVTLCHGQNGAAVSPGTQYLTAGWKLARVPDVTQSGGQVSQPGFDDSNWLNAIVPGTALASFQAAGVMGDPYYSTNMALLESSGYYDVYYWYRDAFTVSSNWLGQKIWLNLDGINWKADVYLNGSFVGSLDGPFVRGKFEVTAATAFGVTNYLAIKLHWCNATVYDAPTFLGVDSWDFMPVIAGRDVGLYQDVYLSSSGPVNIVDPFVVTTLPLPATLPARVTALIGLTNNTGAAVTGTLFGSIAPEGITFQTNLTINAGSFRNISLSPAAFAQLCITNPVLWWPNGYGPQNLHTVQFSFVSGGSTSDVQTVSFGIRQYSYDTNGHELQISCNGQKIFCKGGNWGMPDAMLNYTPAQIDTAVKLHQQMNFTMIRCWHGNSDLKAFYDACDKYGIMVWDEFWLNGSNYGIGPSDPARFIANSIDKYKRLRNRACLAVWCGENEATPPASLELPQNYTNYDNTRIYFPASNSGGIHGGGPYALQDPIWYFSNAHGFTTEIGLPSVPPLESLEAMMPAASLWPLGDTNWLLHDWAVDIGNKGLPQYTNAISSRYGPATGIADFCKKAQLLNLESYRAIFEAWNSKMFTGSNNCSGVLLWMSQPAWPSLIWQTYDWSFELGGAYFGSKKACEPVHIQWDPDDDSIRVVNTTAHSLTNLAAEIEVVNSDGSVVFDTNVVVATLPADTVQTCFSLSRLGNDFALNQPAFASSTDNASDDAANAVDGNLGTRWSSAYSDPQWFYVDLGSNRNFDTVTILWETAYARAFQIEISGDASNWTTVWATNGMILSASGGYSTSAFSPVTARYIRMCGTERATIFGYSMYEFAVTSSAANQAPSLSAVNFIKLKLNKITGTPISDNFYWRGTNYLDYSALNTLPPATVLSSARFGVTNGVCTVTSVIKNPGTSIAFAVRLKMLNQTGARVLPAIYSDNYFSLLPGESKTVTVDFTPDATSSGPLQLELEGWNIVATEVLSFTASPAVPAISPPAALPAAGVRSGTAVTLISTNWSGGAPYGFQWQMSPNGAIFTNLTGANTNFLVIAGASSLNSGFYRVVLTANGQNVTSSVIPLTVSSGDFSTARVSVKFAADKDYGYDAISSGWPAGALGSTAWFNLYGPNGASNGIASIPSYTFLGMAKPSSAVLIYDYAGEVNSINEQAAQPNNICLSDSYVLLNGNGWYLSATNLDAAFTNGYSVYFYFSGTSAGSGGQNYIWFYAGQTTDSPVLGFRQWNLYTTATDKDGHFTQDETPYNTGENGETPGANYCVFSNLTGGAFDLLITNGINGGVNAIEIVANPAATATVLSLPDGESSRGQQTAVVTGSVFPAPPDGESLVFLSGASLLGSGTLRSGTATFSLGSLSSGSRDLTAVYVGDGNYLGSTSGVLNVTITPSFSALQSNGVVVLNWPAGTLLQATNLTGPWITSTAAAQVYAEPIQSQMFYRIRTY